MVQALIPANDVRSLPSGAALHARFRAEMPLERIQARCAFSLSTRKLRHRGGQRLAHIARRDLLAFSDLLPRYRFCRNADPHRNRHELGVINAV
jgi:hypothetical protein